MVEYRSGHRVEQLDRQKAKRELFAAITRNGAEVEARPDEPVELVGDDPRSRRVETEATLDAHGDFDAVT